MRGAVGLYSICFIYANSSFGYSAVLILFERSVVDEALRFVLIVLLDETVNRELDEPTRPLVFRRSDSVFQEGVPILVITRYSRGCATSKRDLVRPSISNQFGLKLGSKSQH